MPKGFDPRCRELADIFLPEGSTREQSDELAQVIQGAIEDHLGFTEDSPVSTDERFARVVK